MSSRETVDRANRIKAEQEALVAALSDDDLHDQLWRKVMDVFTHKAEPSYMSIPVNYERDDDCYVSLRLQELKKRLRTCSAENNVLRSRIKTALRHYDHDCYCNPTSQCCGKIADLAAVSSQLTPGDDDGR